MGFQVKRCVPSLESTWLEKRTSIEVHAAQPAISDSVSLSIWIRLTKFKFKVLSIQVNALNSTCQPLTLTFHGPIKLMVTSSHSTICTSCLGRRPWLRPANLYFWQFLYSSSSIWYWSLGWWWCWFNVSPNLFLTRMSHHLVEPFDSMNYHSFGQHVFFQLGCARSFL